MGGADYLKNVGDEIAEVDVKEALQNDGYFKAQTDAKLTAIQSERGEISVVARIHATPGDQYRSRDIRVESADGTPLKYSEDVLRSAIPLENGELFKVDRVRLGLENLRRLYGREGYVEFTDEVETAFDDEHKSVGTVVRISPGTPYRVGSVEFLGVNAATREKLLKSLPKSGEVFDSSWLYEFFTVNRAILPPDASSDDVTINRDGRSQTVTIVVDLRECPGEDKSEERFLGLPRPADLRKKKSACFARNDNFFVNGDPCGTPTPAHRVGRRPARHRLVGAEGLHYVDAGCACSG
jgi:hypothetical protein